jgi:hypothetical protein
MRKISLIRSISVAQSGEFRWVGTYDAIRRSRTGGLATSCRGRDRCPARGESRIEGRLFNFGEMVLAFASHSQGVKFDRTIV